MTDAIKVDGNVLAVVCYEYSSASWLEDQDFWRLHGLFRSVELNARPAAHVADLHADATGISPHQGVRSRWMC